MIRFIRSETSLVLDNIQLLAFQEKYQLTLPDDYADFLLSTLNGGKVDSNEATIKIDGWGVTIVNSLYGIATGKNHDIDRIMWLIGDDIIPKESIPIGSDPGGNSFFLATEKPHSGKVYFSFHEEEPNDPPTIENNPSLWHVADSFTEFLGKIKCMDKE